MKKNKKKKSEKRRRRMERTRGKRGTNEQAKKH